ncbi:hypothetical protein PZA11_008021 [Diplocarpon coronariae]
MNQQIAPWIPNRPTQRRPCQLVLGASCLLLVLSSLLSLLSLLCGSCATSPLASSKDLASFQDTNCNSSTISQYSSSVMHLSTVCESHTGCLSILLEALPCPATSTAELSDEIAKHLEKIHTIDATLASSVAGLRANLSQVGGIWLDYPFKTMQLGLWQKGQRRFEWMLSEKFRGLDQGIEEYTRSVAAACASHQIYAQTRSRALQSHIRPSLLGRLTHSLQTPQTHALAFLEIQFTLAAAALEARQAQSRNLTRQLAALDTQFRDVDAMLQEYYAAYVPVPAPGQRASSRLAVGHYGQNIGIELTTGRAATYIKYIVSQNRKKYGAAARKKSLWAWISGRATKPKERSWLQDSDDDDEYLYDYLGFGQAQPHKHRRGDSDAIFQAPIDRMGFTGKRLALWEGLQGQTQALCDRAAHIEYAARGIGVLGVAVRVLREKIWLVRERDLTGRVCGEVVIRG